MKKQKHPKKITTYFTWYGESLDDVIIELQNFRNSHPDKTFRVETELDNSFCYYEGDTPIPKVVITEC